MWMNFERLNDKQSRAFNIIEMFEKGINRTFFPDLIFTETAHASLLRRWMTYISDLQFTQQSKTVLFTLLIAIVKLRAWSRNGQDRTVLVSILELIGLQGPDLVEHCCDSQDGMSDGYISGLITVLFKTALQWVISHCNQHVGGDLSSCFFIGIPDSFGFHDNVPLLKHIEDYQRSIFKRLFWENHVQPCLNNMARALVDDEDGLNLLRIHEKRLRDFEVQCLDDMNALEHDLANPHIVSPDTFNDSNHRSLAPAKAHNFICWLDAYSVINTPSFIAHSVANSCFRDFHFKFYTEWAKSSLDSFKTKIADCDVHFIACINPNKSSDLTEFLWQDVIAQFSDVAQHALFLHIATFSSSLSARQAAFSWSLPVPEPVCIASVSRYLTAVCGLTAGQLAVDEHEDKICVSRDAMVHLHIAHRSIRSRCAVIIQKSFRSFLLKHSALKSLPDQIPTQTTTRRTSSDGSLQRLGIVVGDVGKTTPKLQSCGLTVNVNHESAFHSTSAMTSGQFLMFCAERKLDPPSFCLSQLANSIKQGLPNIAKYCLDLCAEFGYELDEIRLEHAERFITSAAYNLVDTICLNGEKIQFKSAGSKALPCWRRTSRDPFESDFTAAVELVKGINRFQNFSLLRKPRMWQQGKALLQPVNSPGFFEYQDSSLKRTMIKISSWRLHGPSDSGRLRRDGIEIFNDLLGFIKARPQLCPEVFANEICKRGREQVLLRDEIYCQILKQSTKPKNEEIELSAWKLLFICLLSFQPMTEDLGRIVFSHICSRLKLPVIIQRYHTIDTVENVAANCFKALIAMHKSSVKLPALTIQRVQQITLGTTYTIRAFILCMDKNLELELGAVRCAKPNPEFPNHIGLNGLHWSTFVDLKLPAFENAFSGDDLMHLITAKSDLVKRISTESDRLFMMIKEHSSQPPKRIVIQRSDDMATLIANVEYACAKQGTKYWLELYPGPPTEDPDWDISIMRHVSMNDSNIDFSVMD
eukprot:CRZ04630.1 hypothetical protein [Spongospora subterranea]